MPNAASRQFKSPADAMTIGPQPPQTYGEGNRRTNRYTKSRSEAELICSTQVETCYIIGN